MNETHIIMGLLAVAFAPGLFWMWYFMRQDKIEPEPLHMIRNCFLYGMAALFVAAFVEQLFPVPMFVMAVVVAPVVEELAKFAVVYLFVYRHDEFDEPMDGVVYAAAVALGFASLENAFYVVQAYRTEAESVVTIASLRAFVSVPGHALFAGMWGYCLGIEKFSEKRSAKGLVFGGLMLGIGLHALFNLLTNLGPFWIVSMLLFVPVVWEMIGRKIDHAITLSPHGITVDPDPDELLQSPPKPGSWLQGPWYENRAIVVLLMFLVCFPAGFYGLWKNSQFSPPVKVVYVVLWVFSISLMLSEAEHAGAARDVVRLWLSG
jgi:RsiW-degrading membrane proteinase PrsW (M82 family)